jgi:sec-independent protein translocase protein TatB
MVVLVVAIVVIGPKDLPRVLRSVGRWSGQVKRMARDFQNQFNEALREAELDSLKKDVEDIAKIDPMADVNAEMAKTNAEIMTELNKPVVDPAVPAAAAPSVEAAAGEPAPALAAEPKPIEDKAPAAAVATAPLVDAADSQAAPALAAEPKSIEDKAPAVAEEAKP